MRSTGSAERGCILPSQFDNTFDRSAEEPEAGHRQAEEGAGGPAGAGRPAQKAGRGGLKHLNYFSLEPKSVPRFI